MKSNVEQSEGTTRQATPDSGSEQSYRRALRILHRCYERCLLSLAESVCDAEEDLETGSDFILSEIENKYLHRLRDLQMAICSLRNRLQPAESVETRTDELQTTEEELPSALSAWLRTHPRAKLVQILVRDAPEGKVLLMPVYTGNA